MQDIGHEVTECNKTVELVVLRTFMQVRHTHIHTGDDNYVNSYYHRDR